MKKILIAYDKMIVGGTTTSLLSMLDFLNRDDYQVDLLLYDTNGIMQSFIPDYVNVKKVSSKSSSRSTFKKILRFVFSSHLLRFIKNISTKRCSFKMDFFICRHHYFFDESNWNRWSR